MATQAPAQGMPVMYNELRPLSNVEHKNWKTRNAEEAPFLTKVHAVPIIVDEFVSAQRFFPIVFSIGDHPVPLALMGLNEGVNVFVDEKGALLHPTYVPAYIRRYPFMLARLQPDSDDLSLCFDPSSGLVGDFEDGTPLFAGEEPSEATQAILKFCEEFEVGAQRTGAFVEELKKADLLIDGELSIQASETGQPAIYRGFKMVDEKKFRDLRGDELRRFSQNGMLPLIVAHLFSLSLSREIFARQVQQGKSQLPPAAPAEAETVIA